MKKKLSRILLGLAIVAAFFSHERGDYDIPFVKRFESIIYDARLYFTMPGGVDPNVVILDIDEKSLKEREEGGEGRWPWPRDRLGLLIEKLFGKYQIEVLGFDVVFAERDETSGVRILDPLEKDDLHAGPNFQAELTKIRPQLEYDDIFADKLRNRKVVLG